MWCLVEKIPKLLEAECHIWLVKVAEYLDQVHEFYHFLDDSEKKRADGFKHNDDVSRYIISRYFLRFFLAKHTDCAVDKIVFLHNEYGKPYLFSPNLKIQFNISHSGQYVCIAYALEVELGVDIEYKKDHKDLDQMAAMIFSKAEFSKYNMLSIHHKTDAFYRAWTYKEALVKCMGQGFSYDIKQCEVSFIKDISCQIFSGYKLYKLADFDKQYAGSIAFRGDKNKIKYLQLAKAAECLSDF